MKDLLIKEDGSSTLGSGMTLDKVEHHFMRKFASCLPAHIVTSSIDAKISAIIHANDERSWGRHTINVRSTLPVQTRTYYFVMFAGIYKRPQSRNLAEHISHPLAMLSNMKFPPLVLLLLACFVLNLFYLLKSSCGLNVARSFSPDIWDSIISSASSR